MKKIKLTKGQYTLIDNEDFEKVNQWKWYFDKYARLKFWDKKEKKYKHITLHRFLMNPIEGMEIDHIDGNKLNNQKSNLRICTSSQNKFNIIKKRNNKSGYKGVSWNSQRQKWCAYIRKDNKTIGLGGFDNKIEAAQAYNNAAKEMAKEFAYLNVI